MKITRNSWLLLAGILAVAGLTWLTGRVTHFRTDPLSMLPDDEPAIQARKVYQRHFLQENDLVVALRVPPPGEPREAAQNLAAHLRTSFPELHERIRDSFPWESNGGMAQMGALAALGWVNASPDALHGLAERLTIPEKVDEALEAALETLATSFSLEPEEAFLAIDPLGLARVPGLPPPEGAASEGLGFGSGDLRAILIDFPGDRNEAAEMEHWQRRIEAAIDAWRENLAGEVIVSGYAPYLVELNASMRRELVFSAIFTLGVVLFLFLLVYRTAYPLAVLAVGLAITALAAIALGGLFFGELNAISIGFAAILIALVVDYNVVVYQEQVQPSDPGDSFRTAVMRPVLWAAATTALVFAALNFSAIPGIAQLGTLVAAGLVLGSAVSLTFFHRLIANRPLRSPRSMKSLAVAPSLSIRVGALLLVISLAALGFRGLPALDTSPETMLPEYSESIVQYQDLRRELGSRGAEPMPVLFRAQNLQEVREAMETWERGVTKLNGVRTAVPHALWPREERDLASLRRLIDAWPMIRGKLDEHFEQVALHFAESAFGIWERSAGGGEPDLSPLPDTRWLLEQAVRIEPGEFPSAKGLVTTVTGAWTEDLRREIMKLAEADARVTLLGWDNLGPTMRRLYRHDSRVVVVPSAVILFVVLSLVFRSVRAVALSVLTLALSGAMLLALMRGLGLAWNQINLMAVPLLLGAGLDYNIHIQLALQRSRGNLQAVGQTTGKALVVCGLSTAAGFASLGWSHHPGLASLGQTCALGILCAMFVAVMLLPGWWVATARQNFGKVS